MFNFVSLLSLLPAHSIEKVYFFVHCVVFFICYRHLLFIILNHYNNRALENRYMAALIRIRACVSDLLRHSVPERSLTGIKCYVIEYPFTKLSWLQVLSSSPFFTHLIVGSLINRPSPHRSSDKLITFTSVLFLRRV